MKSILTTYFSYSGHTAQAAKYIHEMTGGEIYRLETVDPYPKDYNECAYGIAKIQCEQEVWPILKGSVDPEEFELIFLGTPAWWYSMAPAIKTYLTSYDFTGKIIVPFITHGGGGEYDIKGDIANLAHGAQVLDPFVFYEDGGAELKGRLKNFLSALREKLDF